MLNRLGLGLALALSLSLTACSKESSPSQTTANPPAATPAAADKTPAAAAPTPAAAAPARPEDQKFVSDLQEFCKIATEVKADASVAPADKSRRILERLNKIPPGKEFLDTLGKLGSLPHDEQMPALARAAEARGLPGFDCPALVSDNR